MLRRAGTLFVSVAVNFLLDSADNLPSLPPPPKWPPTILWARKHRSFDKKLWKQYSRNRGPAAERNDRIPRAPYCCLGRHDVTRRRIPASVDTRVSFTASSSCWQRVRPAVNPARPRRTKNRPLIAGRESGRPAIPPPTCGRPADRACHPTRCPITPSAMSSAIIFDRQTAARAINDFSTTPAATLINPSSSISV